MAFNINEFKGKFQYDGARPNLFEVVMTNLGNDSRFKCKSASLPGSTIGTASTYYFGREVKMAGNRSFPEWTVTILNDEDFTVRNLLEGWMGAINGHQSNVATTQFAQYAGATDAKVVQYGKTGQPIKEYSFIGMFPTDISPIELDWGSNDTIEEYTVTFAYQYWNTLQSDVG